MVTEDIGLTLEKSEANVLG